MLNMIVIIIIIAIIIIIIISLCRTSSVDWAPEWLGA